MSDLVARLRIEHARTDSMWPIFKEAADRIEALEKEIARLKNPLPTEPPLLSAQGTQETLAKDAAP